MRLQFLALLVVLMPAAALANYELVTFDTGDAIKQSVAVSDASVVVFSSGQDNQRNYQIFPFNGDSSGVTNLPASVMFVDELSTKSGRSVVLIHRDRVTLLGSDETLLEFTSLYNAAVFESIPWFNVFRDLNDDGLDDFLIPSFEGYQVATQRPDGTFSEVITLSADPLMDMSYNSHPWYQAKSVFHGDMTGDGRLDLSVWQKGVFDVYVQQSNGVFAAQVLSLPVSIPLDFDSVDGMSLRFSNEDQSNNTVTVIHSLADYDGDGTSDLMTMTVKSEGVLNKKTTFTLHKGEFFATEGLSQIRFLETPAARVQSNGIQYDMIARDLDSDGDLDLMVSSVELGVGKLIGALLTSSIKIDLGFYPMVDGSYAEKPTTTRNMTATFSLSSGDYWLPAVQILDQDRDGFLDLFVQESEERFITYAGAQDKLFSSRGLPLTAPIPNDPDLIRQLDVNLDGVLDMVMLVPPPLGEKAGHRVVLLLSRSS